MAYVVCYLMLTLTDFSAWSASKRYCKASPVAAFRLGSGAGAPTARNIGVQHNEPGDGLTVSVHHRPEEEDREAEINKYYGDNP